MDLSTTTGIVGASIAAVDAFSESASGKRAAIGAQSLAQRWSFETIYDEFKTPIYNYVYHLVGNREQADDLTQDTFLKAFKALPKMDGNLKLSAWLYRIATNTAYDALRRRKLIAWMPWQDLDHEPADVESADPQETIGTTELVNAALRRMPQHYAPRCSSTHGKATRTRRSRRRSTSRRVASRCTCLVRAIRSGNTIARWRTAEAARDELRAGRGDPQRIPG